MSTKKCSKCGWVYPADWPGRTCKFCHSPLIGGYCIFCGEWYDDLIRNTCSACNTALYVTRMDRRRNEREAAYNEWVKRIAKIPKPHKTLTEAEWHETCRHFGGCAYCGKSEIAARSMFISFKLGGRYCAWNIVPACEKCETAIKATENHFKRADRVLNRNKDSAAVRLNLTVEKINKIVEYLSTKIPGGEV